MSEFVRVRHPDTEGEAEVPAASLPGWEARGWEAITEPRSYSQAEDEETQRAQEDAIRRATARATAGSIADGTREQVLEKVAGDPVLAAEALRAEKDKTQPRVTLVTELERIAAQDPRTDGAAEQGEQTSA